MINKISTVLILIAIVLITGEFPFINNNTSVHIEYPEKDTKQISIQDITRIDCEFAEEVYVLMYHHLLKDDENPYKDNSAILSIENFEQQMKILYENDFNTITLKELEKFLIGEIKLPKRSVLITFDDGYKSNYEYAYPILKEYEFNAVIFAISAWITDETPLFNASELQYLSWHEIENSKDVFEYACHTYDLHRLIQDNKSYVVTKNIDEVKSDLKQSIELLETKYFAYPYGQYNEQTLELLGELGYTMAFTVKDGSVKPGDKLLELNRYGIFPSTTLSRFKEIVGIYE